MTTLTYLQTCDYLGCSSTELVKYLKSRKLTYSLENGRIIITKESIDQLLASVIIEKNIADCIAPVIKAEQLENDFIFNEQTPEFTLIYSAPPKIMYSQLAPSSTVSESKYANLALITAITSAGYNFLILEHIMISIGRKRRGNSGGLNISHLSKILNTKFKCGNKKVRTILAQLSKVGFLSTIRGRTYSLTQRLNSITQPPLRQFLENYLTS